MKTSTISKRIRSIAIFTVTFVILNTPVKNFSQSRTNSYTPYIAQKSNEGQLAISAFRVPERMQATLFAAEPLLANPVAFCIDEQGRFYVCETYRQEKGVEDNRNHMSWLHDDLALQTVEDRLEMFKKHLGEQVQQYTREHDRIRLIEDTNADGVADKSTVFADGFNGILDGTGSGVLARKGDVYYTCIPKLWKLRDTNGDGRADDRTPLHHGYGVRVAFRGHDMHGLTMGPDGRVYYSIGDRGFHVTTKAGKQLSRPDCGAVFRCEPDGSHLEVFAYGLRNPQELAFDDFGNLFTGDNNSDSGDRARFVHVVEGGDTGWRMYYQYLEDRGPWNREMIWYPYDTPPLENPGPGELPVGSVAKKKQPAYIIPPIAHIADGPSGLTYYPGLGLSERYKGHFFLCDFRGNSGRSGIRSFAVKQKGAGFELVDAHQFIWKILATDVDFGYDGSLYISDWVDGWEGSGKGRLYKFTDSKFVKEATAAKTVTLMKTGFEKLSVEKLAKLLEHPDRRIRLEAQFALAGKKTEQVALTLLQVTLREHRLAKLHAVWGLGQLARKDAELTRHLGALWFHSDPEVRAQAIKVFGEALAVNREEVLNIWTDIDDNFERLLDDRHPRVKHFTAIAMGKLGNKAGIEPLLEMLEENNDKDPILRHAAVMGLTGIGRRHLKTLLTDCDHHDQSVRMGILLALRRLKSPEISRFLNDEDPDLVLEAARAINDVPIEKATPQLAALTIKKEMPDALTRRVLNANFRLGKTENAEALVRLAANNDVSEKMRLEALAELQHWDTPSPLDRVTGDWRPLKERPPLGSPLARGGKKGEDLQSIIRPHLTKIFKGTNKVRQAGAKLAAKYGLKEAGPILFQIAIDKRKPGSLRVEALQALQAFHDERLGDIAAVAITDGDAAVRTEGRRLLADLDPQKALRVLHEAIVTGETVEKQGAISVLASMQTQDADTVLAYWMKQMITGKVPAEMQLDLLEAAKKRATPDLQQAVQQFEQSRSKDDPLAQYRESLAGGNEKRGREIFFGRTAASCRRCHKIRGQGGDVGPDLTAIDSKKTREYLLESLVLPNKQITKGFETVVLAMEDGKIYTGVVKSDDETTLKLMNDKGEIVTLLKEEIEEQAKGKSAMPEDLVKLISKADLRDLVEYLSSLRKPVK